ncbi:MAG: hypothetical protein KDC53_17595, partial [Saprospiraceae bacterium]|nr:hypothetical protein [Saprospiraceae bacterium]
MEDSIVHDNYRMDFSSGRILIKQLRRFLIAFILFSLLVSCQREYPISGHIEGINETWRNHVYLIDPLNFDGLATSYLGKVVDSAEITKDGFFAFEKLPMHRTADLMEICVQKQTENHLNGLENDQIGASNYFPLVVKEGTALLVQAKAADFQKSFQIRDPSPENNSMLALRDIRQDAADKWLVSASNESHNPEALLDQEKALLNYQKSLMAFFFFNDT